MVMIEMRDKFKWERGEDGSRTESTYHREIGRRGRQSRRRNEKWMSQKYHSRLPLIRLNAIYLHSNINEYTFLSPSLVFFPSLSFSLSLSLFQEMYLCAAPPLTTLYREKERESGPFSPSLSPCFLPVNRRTGSSLSTLARSSSPGCCSHWLFEAIERLLYQWKQVNGIRLRLQLSETGKKGMRMSISAYPLLLINKEENKILGVSTKGSVFEGETGDGRCRSKGTLTYISPPIRFSFSFELSGMLIQIISRRRRRKRDYQLSPRIERLNTKRIIKSRRTSILNKTSFGFVEAAGDGGECRQLFSLSEHWTVED